MGWKIMINLFPEDIVEEITKIKNMKSKLVINLRNINKSDKIRYYEKIIHLELQIADMEIIRGYHDKAISNIKNGLIFLDKIQNSQYFIEKICLRGLIEEKFPLKNRDLFFTHYIKTKDFFNENLEQISASLRNIYAFVIDEFVQNKFKANIQNLNKSHFYLFQHTPFMYLHLIPKPEIKMGSFPLYSIQFEKIFSNYSENWDVFSIDNNIIYPHLEYIKFQKFANNFKNKILENNPRLLDFYEYLIGAFSDWDTNKIRQWEEKTNILSHFKRGDCV